MWDTSATAAQRDDERQRRLYWREHDELPRRKGPGPGQWVTPAWEGPASPQGPVWTPERG